MQQFHHIPAWDIPLKSLWDMNSKFIIILIVSICVSGYQVCGQQADDRLIGQIMERIAEDLPEDTDYSDIIERLTYYKENPLDINMAGAEDLGELLFISPLQVNAILSHREENGLFMNVLELQAIPVIDTETVRWLLNFLIVKPPQILSGLALNKISHAGEHDLMLRFGKIMEKQDGFLGANSDDPAYPGSSLRAFVRYRYRYAGKLFIALNMEKDAGEPFLRNGGHGFDFYSGSVFLKGKGMVRKLVIGDFSLRFGQGLSMWSGLGFGKGAGITAVAKQDIGLMSYSSANESSFFRGISASLVHERIMFTPFISYRVLDAATDDNDEQITSLNTSGLHRTATERANKNRLSQWVYGFNTQYEHRNFNMGLTAYRTIFGSPIATGDQLYEKFDFHGSNLGNLGLNYGYTLNNTYLFGEAAKSMSSGFAFVNGLISSVSDQVSASILYRHYARNYHSFFNKALSEGSETKNESGMFTGLNISFGRSLEVNVYADFFRFPWLRYRVDAPSKGHETGFRLLYNYDKRFKVMAGIRKRLREENALPDERGSGGIVPVVRNTIRLEADYQLTDNFRVRNRVEIALYRKTGQPAESGFMSYQDIIYNPLSSAVSGNIRFAIFDTSGFNSRIYTYENDVLYGYSIPASQGKGLRSYLNIRYTTGRGMDIWLRYATSVYRDQESVGSGHDRIKGNRRSEIKVQVRLRF
jgi:hypothetical protein